MLRLDSKVNIKNYSYLGIIIGTGLLISITAFLFSAEFQKKNRRKDELNKIYSIHYLFETQLQNQKLHLDALRDSLLESSNIFQNLSLEGLSQKISQSNFSCLYLSIWDPKQKKLVKWNEGIEDEYCKVDIHQTLDSNIFSKKNKIQTLKLRKGKNKRKYFVFNHFISPIKTDQESYIVGLLPIDILLPQAIAGVSVEVEEKGFSFLKSKDWKNNINPLERVVFFLGKQFLVTYKIDNLTTGSYMLWPWLVLLVGFLVTGLFSYFYFTLLIYSSEVTRRVKIKTRELEALTKEAIQANSMKSKFLAGVSHDVRTPLNLMLGMADLLNETHLNTLQKEYVQNFSRAGNHLLDLINGVLDIARIEAGEFIANPENISLSELIVNTSRFISGDCHRRKLNYNYRIHPSVPASVLVDRKLLRQILINLLYNSIKFTRSGDISLEVYCEPLTKKRSKFVFKIQDTGEGIPEEELNLIFQAFQQGQQVNKDLGVGLGLSIVKSIVDHLDGAIKVESTLGQGSTFEVSLNLDHKGQQSWLAPLLEYKPHLKDKKVFLYCDNEMKQQFLSESLQYLGCQVSVYSEGSHATEVLRKVANHFDFIVVDLMISSLGGLEMLKACQFDKENLKKTHILCPLAHHNSDYPELDNLEIKKIILKPIYMERFILSLVNKSSEYETISSPEESHIVLNKSSILIAEDDVDNRNLIEAFLKEDDVLLHFAEDGQVAFNKFETSLKKFDMVITDLQMPHKDGYQLIYEIRKLEEANQLSKTPIVVLTADAQSEQIQKLMDLGADEYLSKPISKEHLRKIIFKFTQYNWTTQLLS